MKFGKWGKRSGGARYLEVKEDGRLWPFDVTGGGQKGCGDFRWFRKCIPEAGENEGCGRPTLTADGLF